MNTGTSEPKREPGAAASSANASASAPASASGEAKEASGALLVQQQLQLLQMQQQQLASMSPSELATMSQQMALFMMPMMPFMMPLNQAMEGAGASTAAGGATAAGSAADSPASAPATGFAGQDDALALLNGAPFGSLEEAPKRKRGRPPKKDVAARAKADAEKTLKQFPMWGYGLPMPMLPGFPNVLAQGLPGAGKNEDGSDAQAGDEDHKDIVGVVADAALEKLNAEAGKPPKKKSRGTGKPRGRPRTRPRPGEIIHRPKPPAIAPANYSVMYNYSLSNLAQKPEDVAAGAGTPSSHDDSRLASLGASLLPGEHE